MKTLGDLVDIDLTIETIALYRHASDDRCAMFCHASDGFMVRISATIERAEFFNVAGTMIYELQFSPRCVVAGTDHIVPPDLAGAVILPAL